MSGDPDVTDLRSSTRDRPVLPGRLNPLLAWEDMLKRSPRHLISTCYSDDDGAQNISPFEAAIDRPPRGDS